MKTFEITTSAKIVVRVPGTWGAARVARELSNGKLAGREGPNKLRPSQLEALLVGAVSTDEIRLTDDQDS